MSEIGTKLIAGVRARAVANPGFVYQQVAGKGCVNVLNGQGSCIVGCGALDSGLIDLDYEFNTFNNGGIYGLDAFLGYVLDRDELLWLSLVQELQDGRTPWGEAVDLADKRHPLGGAL